MEIRDLAREICGDKTVPLAVVLAALIPHYGTKDESVTELIAEIWENIHDHIDCAEANK